MTLTGLESHVTDENVSSVQPNEPIELQVSSNSITNDINHQQEFSLPPADGGKDAWLFLITCFFVEAFVWGFPFSYGIFEDYYSTHDPFVGKSGIPAVGSSALVDFIALLHVSEFTLTLPGYHVHGLTFRFHDPPTMAKLSETMLRSGPWDDDSSTNHIFLLSGHLGVDLDTRCDIRHWWSPNLQSSPFVLG